MISNILFLSFTLVLNFLFYKKFKSFKFFSYAIDVPDNNRKIHKYPTSLAGGTIIIINIFIIFVYGMITSNFEYSHFFFLSSLGIFILGLYDDKFDLSPNKKFLFLIIIFSSCYFYDSSFQINDLFFETNNNFVNIKNYSFFFTILCLLLFSNALNMFDGINLQCILYCFLTLIYLLFLNQTIMLKALVIVFFFLGIINFKNLSFIGNSGSYLSSFIISYHLISFYNEKLINNVEEIFILLMLPGIDMLRVFTLRVLAKQNPFKGDKKHIHHILLKKYNYKIAIIIITALVLLNLVLLTFNANKLNIVFIFLFLYSAILLRCKFKRIN